MCSTHWRVLDCKNNKALTTRLVNSPTSDHPHISALAETHGSIMEKYHERYKNTDDNDIRLQDDMFCHLNAPPVLLARPYVRKIRIYILVNM
jgi:hypothetical protein